MRSRIVRGPWGRSPEETWAEIEARFTEVYDGDRARLREEASWLDLEHLEPVWAALHMLKPEVKLRLFQQKNPDINVLTADRLDPYRVAVGVLRMFAEE